MRIKAKGLVIPAAFLLLAGIYIGSNRNKAVNPARRAEIIRRTKRFIGLINSRNYSRCYEKFDEHMKSSSNLSDAEYKFDTILKTLGEFKQFRTSQVFKPDDNMNTSDIACSVRCSYDAGDVIITVIFNKEKKVSGIYIK
jgi:hypothetical protein